MIPPRQKLSVPYGERDTKLTEYKEQQRVPKYRSLYLGLFVNIIRGLLIAVLVFFAIYLPSTNIIDYVFVTPENQHHRRESYISDLQEFVTENKIGEDNTVEISEWIRGNPYVYLIVYENMRAQPSVFSVESTFTPGPRDRYSEYVGSRISESISRNDLMSAARANGYYRIELKDGYVTVAIVEYTENLYYMSFNLFSIIAAAFTFFFSLVRYIRVIIQRIKRFESDVTIVSEIDMNYEIVSEGADEIANLSGQVEQMRQRMLEHIKSEQEAREANTELVTSISHDIRTPLTVLMGYIEMMKDHAEGDELMEGYIASTESTALRLKQLSDDMFKYSLAFGDTNKSVKLEEYDAMTIFQQLFAEHFLLMRENGYVIQTVLDGDEVKEGSTISTDAPNLMRIIDNIFSNLRKYADKEHPIVFKYGVKGGELVIECCNTVLKDNGGAESNGIGLKTCKRLAPLIAKSFDYERRGDMFISRLVIDVKEP